jgi:hypothetical protein
MKRVIYVHGILSVNYMVFKVIKQWICVLSTRNPTTV